MPFLIYIKKRLRIKATFNVAGSAEGGLSNMSKEIAREQFPSKSSGNMSSANSEKIGTKRIKKQKKSYT